MVEETEWPEPTEWIPEELYKVIPETATYRAKLENTTLELVGSRINYAFRDYLLQGDPEAYEYGRLVLHPRRYPDAEPLGMVLILTVYQTNSVHLTVTTLGFDKEAEAKKLEHLRWWLKAYYDATLTPANADEAAEALELLGTTKPREKTFYAWFTDVYSRNAGRKPEGFNVWLWYMITQKRKRTGDNPDGKELYALWRKLLEYEKPGKGEGAENEDSAFESYRHAVAAIRRASKAEKSEESDVD
jgi:hypothetical protein